MVVDIGHLLLQTEMFGKASDGIGVIPVSPVQGMMLENQHIPGNRPPVRRNALALFLRQCLGERAHDMADEAHDEIEV